MGDCVKAEIRKNVCFNCELRFSALGWQIGEVARHNMPYVSLGDDGGHITACLDLFITYVSEHFAEPWKIG